jgi:hypothetical protein
MPRRNSSPPPLLPDDPQRKSQADVHDERVARPVAALNLGYYVGLLAVPQQILCDVLGDDANYSTLLDCIHQSITVLADNLSAFQFAQYTENKARLELLGEIAARYSQEACLDPSCSMEVAAQPLREFVTVDDLNRTVSELFGQARSVMMRLALRSAESHPNLNAYYTVGLEVAKIVAKVATDERAVPLKHKTVEALIESVGSLNNVHGQYFFDLFPIDHFKSRSRKVVARTLAEAFHDFRDVVAKTYRDGYRCFRPLADYRRCVWLHDGKRYEFDFNEAQSNIIKCLHWDWELGGMGVQSKQLLDAGGANYERLDHYFYRCDHGKRIMHDAWKLKLLVSVSKGVYRLNLSSLAR